MLQSIRDKVTGWIAVVIVALLCIPFAFWGINYYFSGGSEPVVAKVNGEEIKLSEYQRTYTNYRTQMQAMFDRNIGPDDEAVLKQETLDRLVESELLNQQTREAGLFINDMQVRETIKNIDIFKGESGFSRQFYEQSVRQFGLTPAGFEQQVRLDMMSEQLQSAIIESEFATREEAERLAILNAQERNLNYVMIPASRFADEVEISDEDISTWYQENPGLYVQPEAVRIAYIELKLENLAEQVEVTGEDLQVHYEENKAQYDQEEQRKLTQILFKTPEEMPEEQQQAMKAMADKAMQEIRSGKSFADIVTRYTENPDSNILISEYGYMAKGVLNEKVEEAAFNMETNDVSDIVESEQGFHIIKLEDIKGGVMNTFENNREAVEKDVRNKRAEEQFFELADKLGALAFEHPDSLEVASEDTGLPVQETDFITREGSDEGIASDARVIEASFSEDVLAERLNSDVIEIGERNLLVLRVREHREETRLPLEEVREQVISDLRQARTSEMAEQTGKRIAEALKAGESFENVAASEGIEWENATGIKREDISINRAILRLAFRLPQPADGQPVVAGTALGTGDYAVVAVLDAQQPGVEEIKGKKIDDMMSQIEISRSSRSWGQLLDQMISNADISVFRDRVQ